MNEIKTRAEALKASIEKWTDISTRMNTIINDIEKMCGFCDLARDKATEKEPPVFRCNVCEPDAKKLCKKYINEDQLITGPLSEAGDKAESLLRQLRLLPVDLK